VAVVNDGRLAGEMLKYTTVFKQLTGKDIAEIEKKKEQEKEKEKENGLPFDDKEKEKGGKKK
jgi:hypothetical protein